MDKYIFEAIMLVCFGISWPVSITKALRTKFVRGKSRLFMTFVIVGYVSGVLHKFLNPDPVTHRVSLVVWLYIFNLAMVVVDLVLYMRYRHNPERVEVLEPEGP